MPTAPPPLDLLVFNAQPGATLLLSPEWLILGASDDYLAATLTERATLVGQHIFAAFPDNPDAPEANAVANVRASLEQVLATKQPHDMAPQHYDVPDPAHRGHFVERHWQPRHTPVLDAAGQVQFIIQSVQDITARRVAERQLRESQAAEQAARAAADRERQQLHHVLEQAPAMICIFDGPAHVFQFVNPPYQALVGDRPLVGKPIAEAMPELAGQPVFDLLDRVYRTGETYYAHEMLVQLDHRNDARPELEKRYYNFIYQARCDPRGAVDGILVFAYEVTPQVQARQQVQGLNEELAALNEELQATNDEFLNSNAALAHTQQQLQQLNQELEARVQARTRELEDQQRLLGQILAQVPAAITTLQGPEHRFTFANDLYQRLVGGRVQTGRTVAETLPEVVDQGFLEVLDNVYRTGQTFEGREIAILLETPGQPPAQHYLDFTYQPMPDAHGQPQGILAFVVDVTAQVRARHQAQALQAELLASAQRQAYEREAFHNVFEQTPALVALLRDPGHRFEYVNPAYQAFFPVPLAGLEAAEATPELYAQGFGALLDRVFQTGETYFGAEVPFTPVVAPGAVPQELYFNFTYQAYRENSQVMGVSIFAVEVTEQVLARRERDAKQRQFLHVFEQAPVAMALFQGPDYLIEVANARVAELWGRTPDQVLGLPLFDALPEVRGQGFKELLDQVVATGEAFVAQEVSAQLLRKDQLETLLLNFVYQPLRDEQGRIGSVVAVAIDVTEQVHVRQRVEAQAQQLRLLTDALPVLIGYLDHERRYRFANEAYRTWFNQDPAALLGQKVRDVVGETAYAAAAGYMDRALAGERLDFEATMPYREGFTKHIRTSYVPDVRDGQVMGFYTLVNDVTEQVQARQQVQHLNEELAAINEELTATNEELHTSNTQLTHTNVDLDNFVYAASHDLKAPITNIEGLLHTLRDELPAQGPGSEVAYILDLMQDSVARFTHTISLLTDVAKLQQEYGQPATATPLAPLLDAVRLDLAPLLAEVSGSLDVDVHATPTLPLAEKNLRSVLYNLLSNAFKYHDPARPAHVVARSRVEAPWLVLEVEDNGLGLDLTREHGLFTMFRRFHTHVPGSGVGLHMVKKLVENAGGKIEVDSKLGQGSTFSVYLPG